MKNGWKRLPLSDFVKSKGGNNKIIKGAQSDHPREGLAQGFSASGPDVWVQVAEYNQPGVVISAVGARCGKTFLADGKWTAIANTHVLLPSDGIDNRWLWYRTNDEGFWVKGGAAQPFVKVKETLDRLCMIPPISEQQRIVRVLDEAFAGMSTVQGHVETNLGNARGLYESHLRSIFSKRSNEWFETKLGDIADFKNGLNFTKQSRGHKVRIVGVGDFQNNAVVPTEALESVTIDGKLDDDFLIRHDDILAVRSNGSKDLVGRCMLVPEINGAISYSGFIIRIRFDRTTINPRFLLRYLKSSETRSRLTRDGSGANISNINQGKLAELPVLLPTLRQQERIANKLELLALETQRLEILYQRKLAALSAMKKSLLHQAFSGAL